MRCCALLIAALLFPASSLVPLATRPRPRTLIRAGGFGGGKTKSKPKKKPKQPKKQPKKKLKKPHLPFTHF